MRRLIINIEGGVKDRDALRYVDQVITNGLVSKGGTQYCYATSWPSGVIVYADKTENGTHSFRVKGPSK